MTTSKVKKMLLTDAAIALSRSRCRPNRGPYSHLVVCVCLSLSLQCAAMVTRRRTTTTARREEKQEQQGLPNHVAAMAAFAFMADTPIYKKDLQ